jgi:hypothetical protein
MTENQPLTAERIPENIYNTADHFKEMLRPLHLSTSSKTRSERVFEQAFETLCADTRNLSDTTSVLRNSSFWRLVELGTDAIPMLFAGIDKNPLACFHALREITNENPVPPEHYGNMQMMKEDWISWGKTEGYVSD